MEEGTKKHLFALLLIFILARGIFLLWDRPLLKDENLYAEMADEFLKEPKLVPDYLGQEVAWRPVVYFLVSAPFVIMGNSLAGPFGIDAGLPYRLAPLFFGALSLFVMYFLVKREFGEDTAFASCALFAVSFCSVYADTSALVDSVLLFLILGSLYFYFGGTRKGSGKYYLAGGLFMALAYWTKTVVAFLIPVVVVAYVFCKKKEDLRSGWLIASLLILPVSMLFYDSLFTDRTAITGEYLYNIPAKLIGGEGTEWNRPFLDKFSTALREIFAFNFLIFGAFLFSLRKNWRGHLWLSVWALLILLTLFVGAGYFWYPLPVMPAICVFVAFLLFEKRDDGKMRADRFSIFVLALLCLLIFISSVFFLLLGFEGNYFEEREAGKYLQGKENVLYIGAYMPTAVFYKMRDGMPAPCIVYAFNETHLNESDFFKSNIYHFGEETNYSYNFRISQMFWNGTDLKVRCGRESFDYVLTCTMKKGMLDADANYSLVKSFGNLSVWERE